ncbi:MAG: chemotaxis protein CheW [Desulfotomaculales bacterium]
MDFDDDRQVIVFQLGDQHYALPIPAVQTIIRPAGVTPIPGTTDLVEGVINLRGKVIPVLNLNRRLGPAARDRGPETRIIVVEQGGSRVGIVADRVVAVGKYEEDNLEPLDTVAGNRNDWLTGVIKKKEGLWLLLDLDRVLQG